MSCKKLKVNVDFEPKPCFFPKPNRVVLLFGPNQVDLLPKPEQTATENEK